MRQPREIGVRHRKEVLRRYRQKLIREGRCTSCGHKNDRLPKRVCKTCMKKYYDTDERRKKNREASRVRREQKVAWAA